MGSEVCKGVGMAMGKEGEAEKAAAEKVTDSTVKAAEKGLGARTVLLALTATEAEEESGVMAALVHHRPLRPRLTKYSL
jgi:hypothetical protein